MLAMKSMAWIARSLATCSLVLPFTVSHGQPQCDAIVLHSYDLRQLLASALGDLRQFAERYDAKLVPDDPSCYIHMSITTVGLPPLLPSCEMQACSVTVVSGQRIALREFDISGCDALFSALPLSRRVRTSFADARERISSHCASGNFEFESAALQQHGAAPGVVLELKAIQP
ncbi:MAG TPA: hypothetical protein VHB01_06915 [Nitrosospira sp.]|nr:hypothetical protein [Nitrosospira sp.]